MARPLVSIISFCKDRRYSIQRSVESVLNQSYTNIEFVIQDGVSTDGTLQILQEYAARDPRIKLISEPDVGHEEAFWKVLRRCSGDIIGTCLSDEELLPDAVVEAVDILALDREAGAITGNGYVTDENGAITEDFIAGEFNIVDYLFGRYCPLWPASFFRTKALADVGLFSNDWTLDCLEFEIWCRLGTNHLVKSVPNRFSKYAIHAGQLSNTPRNVARHVDARLDVIAQMFSEQGFFGRNERRKIECMINQLSMFRDHARAYGMFAQEQEFENRIGRLESAVSDEEWLLERASYAVETKANRQAGYLWALMAQIIGSKIRSKIGIDFKKKMRATLLDAFVGFALLPQAASRFLDLGRSDGVQPVALSRETPRHHKIYIETAAIYEARGQIHQALDLWRAAEPRRDATAEGLACQGHLKLPTATERDVSDHQHRWAERHAVPDPRKDGFRFASYDGKRKIKVGYHCSFFDGDTIRAMMGAVVAKHDREKFVVFGYSPVPVPSDITNGYDLSRNTAFSDDGDFVDLVRDDEIDILVELTGFSPGHRFAAMASRCAPVQVSYLNHTATSGVPNVDYVLSDDICTPRDPDVDACFSERIYRLPGCFFCFDYAAMATPPVMPPPFLKRGHPTFGCFGSGGKINETLIATWAQLLHRVPDSMFFLKNSQLSAPGVRHFVIDQFRRYGIDSDRLRVEGGADRMSLLACYSQVDVTLDTWPYCGGNTVAESLWQGVPVVTWYGTRFSSRYGASLITAAGCEDLIGKSAQEYIDAAATLVGNADRLARLRGELRHMCKQHGLGDSGRFARILEQAFTEMLSAT